MKVEKNSETARVTLDCSYTEAGIIKLALQLLACNGERPEKKAFSPNTPEEAMYILKDALKHKPVIAQNAEDMADEFNRVNIFMMHSYAATK